MSQEKFYIPKHLDDMPKFLLWNVDEAVAFIVPLFLGFVLGKGLIGLFVTVLCFHFWKKIKGSRGQGGQNFIKYLIYWNYPKWVLGLAATPDSSIRNYIG